MKQFDSSQAYRVLALPELKLVDGLIRYALCDRSMTIVETEQYIEDHYGARVGWGDEDKDNDTDMKLAHLSAVVSSISRWGDDESKVVSALQSERTVSRDSEATVPLGESIAKFLDDILKIRIGIDSISSPRWKFDVVSGVLSVRFYPPGNLAPSKSYPVASACRRDLNVCRTVLREKMIKSGHAVPSGDIARESLAKACAMSCSPTICGGWLNLGLYMASAWEQQRRRLVRDTNNPKALPIELPVDDSSIVDYIGTTVDLGPIRVDRVAEINHRCVTRPDSASHKFLITKEHERSSKQLGGVRHPTLAPCGVCGGNYTDHTCDRVLILYLIRDITQVEARRIMPKIEAAIRMLDIDGVVFQQNESFKFLNQEYSR